MGAGGQGGDSSDGTAQTSTTSGNAGGEGGAAPETSASSGGTGASPGSGGTGASPGSGGTSTCKDACDCDGDGALSEACQGDDCDDNDPLAYPSQKSFFATPRGAAGFDYNCDGQSERQFDAATKCGALLSCSEGASDGFLGTLPACGETGTWGRCKVDGLLCVDEVIENARTMLCR